MATKRNVKLAGPYYREAVSAGAFYKVLSVTNTLIVRPGEYYTEGAVKTLMDRSRDRHNPISVNIVEAKKAGFPSLENIEPQMVIPRVAGR